MQRLGVTAAPVKVIIVGVDYAEYQLSKELEKEGRYRVLFFINEDPWKNRTTIGDAELRYPTELAALCINHGIETVFYINDALLENLPAVNVPVVKWTTGQNDDPG